MSYRRSISTLGCPEYSLEQVLDLAKRHRLDAVEIRALSNTIDVPAVLPLEVDMVFNLESAIFMPGVGATHIERTFGVTAGGAPCGG